ncbi:MAG: ribonuclease HI [Sphingobacteriia bacterium]|nr:ribonuclease HI [Sphingobacteriia bacterium]
MKKVTIYTDGACSKNPGPGAWAAILIYNNSEKIVSGFAPDTTNNRMELMAAIEALKALKEKCEVNLYTDSRYVKQGITEWIEKWKRTNFKDKQNVDLWLELDEISKKHEISWHWVQAHSIHELNNRVDAIARGVVKQYLAEKV